MGYISHKAILVTSCSGQALAQAHQFAKERMPCSEIVLGKINDYASFFVPPDGSKEGWETSDEADLKYNEIIEYLDSCAHEDGSNSLSWAFVQYGNDDYETRILDCSDDRASKAQATSKESPEPSASVKDWEKPEFKTLETPPHDPSVTYEPKSTEPSQEKCMVWQCDKSMPHDHGIEDFNNVTEYAPKQMVVELSRIVSDLIDKVEAPSESKDAQEPVKPDRLEKILEIQIELHKKLASCFMVGISKVPECYIDASKAYQDALSKIEELRKK